MLSRPNASVEDAMSTMTANIFSEIMSDYIHNSEQNAEMAAKSQCNSTRASQDSANPADGAEITTQSNHGLLWKSLTTAWMSGRTLTPDQHADKTPPKK